VGNIEDVYLHTLDTLGRVVQQNMTRRESAVAAAEAIIDTHADAFMSWLAQRGSVPVIQQLRSRAEQYRQIELERAQKLLARGDDPQKVIEALANGLTNKFLHHPMAAIRQASGAQRAQLAEALERLYPNSPNAPDSPDNADGADATTGNAVVDPPAHRAPSQD
jgi:glutamyl-tRNA reductase